MNHHFKLTIKTNKILYTIVSLCVLCFLSCTSNKTIRTGIPIVCLSPEKAEILKISDFFDNYKLYEFKGTLFSGIDDFMELGDKRIAILNYYSGDRSSSPKKLAIFDTLGSFLYQIATIGRGPGEYLSLTSSIQIKKDSSFDIIDLNGHKYLNYSIDNKLMKEQLSLYTLEGGFPQVYLNDTLLLIDLSSKFVKSPQFKLHLTLADKQIVYKKYLPVDISKKDYLMKINDPYKINDTTCIYSEEDACIYNILVDSITPRYYFDKGKHAGFIKYKDLINGKTDNNYILNIRSFENNKYLFGNYTFNNKIYYYIYDKKKETTYNYKSVNEDIVFMNNKKNREWPSQVIFLDINSLQLSDKYLYMSFSQSKFRNLVESVKNNLTPQQWENYCQTHQDIIAAYESYDEETSNPVIIGFKYK